MPNRIPLSAAVALLGLPLIAAAADPGLLRSVGLDVWSLPALQRDFEECRSRGRDLDARNDDVRKRIMIKEALVGDLIAGRSSLEETATQFLVLNETSPEYMEVIRLSYEGSSDMEKTMQNVIDFATLRVPEGERRDELTARLDVERDRFRANERPLSQ